MWGLYSAEFYAESPMFNNLRQYREKQEYKTDGLMDAVNETIDSITKAIVFFKRGKFPREKWLKPYNILTVT